MDARILLQRGIATFGALSFDQGQFAQHGDPIAECVNLRAWLIGPIHRNFCDPVSALLCHVEQFEIKPIAIDGGHSKEICCHSSAEQFESALRVGDPSEAAPLHDEIEQVAQHGSMKAGLDGIVRRPGGERARSDGQVCAVGQGLFESGKFLNRRGAVRIGKELYASDCRGHSSSHGGAFPLAQGGAEQLDFRGCRHHGFNHGGRGIGAAVVCYEDFVGLSPGAHVGGDILKRGKNASGLIMGRNDDRALDGV